MTLLKYFLVVVLFITVCNAETEPPTDQWIDFESIKVRQEKSIQYVTRIGEILPAIKLLEINDGRLAAVLSLNSPEYSKRDKEWVNDFRIVYQTNDNSREIGELDGESFNIPNGKWVSGVTFLTNLKRQKKEISYVNVLYKSFI